ncbi:MAG TPA: hypothetical protein VJ692_09385 [Nitrospiraceae bacterium]|nr:hypothetical protein [Nitrospiraceae bacterium]
MATSEGTPPHILRELAGLMLAVAGESVTMVKRSAPERALKMKKQQEWTVYLEFLKVLFNLADRLVAFHLPIQERPHFMNSLEDTVSEQLKNVLAPALGSDADMMEVVLTIGKTVAESRHVYEQFAFLPTEESPKKEQFFKAFAERVAEAMQTPGNGSVISAATMCANAAIPAMNAAFSGTSPATSGNEGMEKPTPSVRGTGNEIKLISVMAAMEGEAVETRWGLHPRFRQDLKPEEVQQLSRLMNRLTRILGERYAAVAFSDDWTSWHHIGHA